MLVVAASGLSFDGCQRASNVPDSLFLHCGTRPCWFSQKNIYINERIHLQYGLYICIFAIFSVHSLEKNLQINKYVKHSFWQFLLWCTQYFGKSEVKPGRKTGEMAARLEERVSKAHVAVCFRKLAPCQSRCP